MKQHEHDIGNIIEEALNQHSTSISFEKVWERYPGMNKRKIFRLNKLIVVPMLSLITLFALFAIGSGTYKLLRNIDKTDYPFVDDSRVIGKWESVDFVKNIEDFNPETRSWKEELYLKAMVFIKQGEMLSAVENDLLAPTMSNWTKDMVVNKYEKTASKYVIKEINGDLYMFCQWKNWDYIFENMVPYFYVLKKVDSLDYSDYEVKQLYEDKIDYPFIDDPQMRGKWKSVDIVRNIDDFKPMEKSWVDDLFLSEMEFKKGGKLTVKVTNRTFALTWTKGLVINKYDKTASKCEIKEIDGKEYMFFEWKSGDYIYRGMEPPYYVLEKVR